MTLIPDLPLSALHHQKPLSGRHDTSLRPLAQQFEARILADLLRSAGAGEPVKGFGGGIGEDQFASFLVDAQAERIAARGGLGIAEMVMRTLLGQGGKS